MFVVLRSPVRREPSSLPSFTGTILHVAIPQYYAVLVMSVAH